MKDRRTAKRYALDRPGRILIDGVSHKCMIYDKSKSGARLIRFGDLKLPQQFLVQADSAAQPCWLIWQADGEAGVSFTRP